MLVSLRLYVNYITLTYSHQISSEICLGLLYVVSWALNWPLCNDHIALSIGCMTITDSWIMKSVNSLLAARSQAARPSIKRSTLVSLVIISLAMDCSIKGQVWTSNWQMPGVPVHIVGWKDIAQWFVNHWLHFIYINILCLSPVNVRAAHLIKS